MRRNELSQVGRVSPGLISHRPTDTELSRGILPDPGLFILLKSSVAIPGYSPWHLRIKEIFHLQDLEILEHYVFLKALWNYTKAQSRCLASGGGNLFVQVEDGGTANDTFHGARMNRIILTAYLSLVSRCDAIPHRQSPIRH